MWTVLVSIVFCISCSDGLPGIWSIKFWIILVLSFYIFETSIWRSLHLESFWSSLREIILSTGTVRSTMIHVFTLIFFIVMSGRFASIFLSVLIVKSHRIVTSVLSVTGCGVCSYHFSVWGRLKFLHYIQCMNLAIRSCLWRYSVLKIVGHADILWSTVSSLSVFVHGLQLWSAPLLRTLDWYALVDMLWSWAASIKPSVSPFKLEMLSHWWVVALSIWAFSVLKGYFSLSILFSCLLNQNFWLFSLYL